MATIRYLDYILLQCIQLEMWWEKRLYNCSFLTLSGHIRFRSFFKRNNTIFWHEINLSLGIILNKFLIFSRFEPQYSYKLYSYKKSVYYIEICVLRIVYKVHMTCICIIISTVPLKSGWNLVWGYIQTLLSNILIIFFRCWLPSCWKLNCPWRLCCMISISYCSAVCCWVSLQLFIYLLSFTDKTDSCLNNHMQVILPDLKKSFWEKMRSLGFMIFHLWFLICDS